MADEPIWATAISSNGDRKIIYRYLETPPTKAAKAGKPVRAILKWPYESESGLPDREATDGMAAMEDALESSLERGGVATLTLVSTGEGFREWVYYTESEETFLEGLNEALKL